MKRRAATVGALLLALLVPAAPASADTPVAMSGRVLDEAGRPVAGATVRFSLYVPPGFADSIGYALGCLFSFGFACDGEAGYRVPAEGRTDRSGRYVLRFSSTRKPLLDSVRGVEVTGPTLVRGTLPATTSMEYAYPSGTTLPAFRLWMRGATVDPVSATRRRLRAGVPKALGTPVRPARVALVQGTSTVWSYGEVARDRDVDPRVVEEGTTGTQTTVTTRVGKSYVYYRSGVRPVTKAVRPLSRGKACYRYRGVLSRHGRPCPLTDGDLAEDAGSEHRYEVVVDLGALSVPDAYVARDCRVYAVSGSIDGEVFSGIKVAEKERHVYTGKPERPVRYVRLDVGSCPPSEVAVFGAPFRLPVPVAAPRTPPAPVPVTEGADVAGLLGGVAVGAEGQSRPVDGGGDRVEAVAEGAADAVLAGVRAADDAVELRVAERAE